MIYLKEFNTQAEYEAAVEANEIRRPNVSLVNEPFAVHYNKHWPLGVFIQHIDGMLYTKDEWSANKFSNDEANGVAVVAEAARFVIAKKSVGSYPWHSNISAVIEGVARSSSEDIAKNDLRGLQNTKILLETDTRGASFACANFTFPNGKKGYLAAAGEWNIVGTLSSEVNSTMALIGGSQFERFIWSSTQYDSGNAWNISDGPVSINSAPKSTQRAVRPFTTLE